MSGTYWFVISCGVLALVYGVYAGRSVLSSSAGTERMQEISAAIQEGANAYLNRQYRAIALVGVVIGVLPSCFGHLPLLTRVNPSSPVAAGPLPPGRLPPCSSSAPQVHCLEVDGVWD